MLKKIIPLSVLSILIFGCETNEINQNNESTELIDPEPIQMTIENDSRVITVPNISKDGRRLAGTVEREVSLYSAEFITHTDSKEIGNIIIFNNRGNKQLGADFVPGQSIDGSDAISYYVDNTRPSQDLPVEVTNAAIDRAMATWDNVDCSDLNMTERPFNGFSSGFIAGLFNPFSPDEYGGSPFYFADINHAGWLPGSFFDFLTQNGSQSILGVTFTLVFTENGKPIDENNDGKDDVAFREIYYNDAFTWGDGEFVDVESIALHEAGHGLSQAHFGKAMITGLGGKNPKLQISPRAVMNAGYFGGIATDIEATDNGGHCSIWANWPNN